MKYLLLLLGFTATALGAPLTSLTVVRYTVVDAISYLYEEGELTSRGFGPTWSYTQPYIQDAGPTKAEVSALSGMPLQDVDTWALRLREDPTSLQNYTMGPQQLNLAGDKVSFISWSGSTSTPSKETSGSQLVNISFRAVVPSNGTIIPGFVIQGGPQRVLLRVAGPGLAVFGVTGTLANPKLSLYQGTIVIASNDNWGDTTKSAVTDATQRAGAFPFVTNSKDAAMVTVLAPGAYTVKISGDANTTGEVLFEAYAVPMPQDPD